ncbi:YitT family protein [Priestia koreensis]|uniref:YitT family protein n=1 Tax=Priestia koreensis TaxID=284581 RepID=UPI001F5A2777|nr:YitT family protein [Priestia koreensis]MCM3004486.1 YitT family protein [Priestia koreensis]UNL84694.1 YitT family protein [Priestia koreensis]
MKSWMKEIIYIIIGSFLFAFGINYFALPNELAEGGVTGITMITYYLFKWSPGTVSFILNSILLIIGYRLLQKRIIIYTIISIVTTSLSLYATEHLQLPLDDTLLAAIFAGVVIGVGLGLVFRAGGTTGGSTVLARMMTQYFGWSMSKGMLFFDLIVVISASFVIGLENMMYTIISIYISTKVIDYIMEGMDSRKAVTVISSQALEIADKINKDVNRGVTVFSAQGGYTKEAREILYIVINKQELFEVKKVIHHIDQKAFVVIHDVRDVFGEGFTLPRS